MEGLPDGYPRGCAERFRPERMLAQGGFGAVWLAHQISLSRPAAVKILRFDLPDNSDARERFLHEARITAALAHPAVVRVLDHDVEAGVPWIAFEYVEGRNLAGYLVEMEPSWPGALQAVLQIARALELAHGQGILHRDIKPENVLEASPGQWKITDFGIAKWIIDNEIKTPTGVVMGTPTYISPEQVAGRPAGVRSDLYSLGVLAFESLVGRPPCVDQHLALLLDKHLRAERPAPSQFRPGLPAEVDDAVRRWIALDPLVRPDSAAAMGDEIERLLALPEAADAPPERRRPVRPTGRARVLSSPDRAALSQGRTQGLAPEATQGIGEPRGTRPIGAGSGVSPRPGGSGRYARKVNPPVTEAIPVPSAPSSSRPPMLAAFLVAFGLAGAVGVWIVRGQTIAPPAIASRSPASPSAAPSAVASSPSGPPEPVLRADDLRRIGARIDELAAALRPLDAAFFQNKGEVEIQVGDFDSGTTMTEMLEGKSELMLVRDRLRASGTMPHLTDEARRVRGLVRPLGPLVFRAGVPLIEQVRFAWFAGFAIEALMICDRMADAEQLLTDAQSWPSSWLAPFLDVRANNTRSRIVLERRGFAFVEKCVPQFKVWEARLREFGTEDELEARPGGRELLAVFHGYRFDVFNEFPDTASKQVAARSLARAKQLVERMGAAPSARPEFTRGLIGWSGRIMNTWLEQVRAAERTRAQPRASPSSTSPSSSMR